MSVERSKATDRIALALAVIFLAWIVVFGLGLASVLILRWVF